MVVYLTQKRIESASNLWKIMFLMKASFESSIWNFSLKKPLRVETWMIYFGLWFILDAFLCILLTWQLFSKIIREEVKTLIISFKQPQNSTHFYTNCQIQCNPVNWPPLFNTSHITLGGQVIRIVMHINCLLKTQQIFYPFRKHSQQNCQNSS